LGDVFSDIDAADTAQRRRILIADDETLVRDILALYLNRQSGFVTSTCSTLEEVHTAIERDGPFDAVLLDFAMPGVRGVPDVARTVVLNDPEPVVLLSGNASRDVVFAALSAGAKGFLPKSLSPRALINAVNFVLAGEVFLPSSIHEEDGTAQATGKAASGLTGQERRVLAGLCEGMSNKEIARHLELSEVTVKMHMRNLMQKLGAKNRTHAALIALESRVVEAAG